MLRRIEFFLEDFGWAVKICLVIIWFLWAIQLWKPFVQATREEIQYQRNRNKTQEMQYIREVTLLAMQKVEAAKVAGKSYSPQQYFEDLKEIDEKVELYRVPGPQWQINELFQISWTNINKGYFNESDVEAAREAYKEQKFPSQKEFVHSVKQSGWTEVLNWLIIFYLRSMLLSLFFYLIRMVERKGILQTILADKKKFVLAIAGWIYYFFKYPNNVIKEVVVEAELRRLGGLFRKLNPKEIALVKQVANSTSYKEWLTAFRGYNLVKFQRGLLVAVFGTIILYVLSPAVSASISPRKQKQLIYKGSMIFLNKDSPSVKSDLVKAKQVQEKLQKFNLEKWVVASECILAIHLPLFKWLSSEISTIWKNRFIKKIDHIPVIDCLVSRLTKTLNQIVEGICFLRHNLGGNNEKVICGNFGSVGAYC